MPSGDADDLSKLPALEGQEFVVTGAWRGEKEVASDLQLSSLGENFCHTESDIDLNILGLKKKID